MVNSFEALALTQRRLGFEEAERTILATVHLQDMLFKHQKRSGIIFTVTSLPASNSAGPAERRASDSVDAAGGKAAGNGASATAVAH